jgi:hypothetical protein
MGEQVPRDVLTAPGMGRRLDTLSNQRRRLVLFTLERGYTTNESDLVFRGPGDEDDVEEELLHHHLPKLVEAGYIEWDRETGEISKGPRYDEIEPLLALIEDHADELPPGWL